MWNSCSIGALDDPFRLSETEVLSEVRQGFIPTSSGSYNRVHPAIYLAHFCLGIHTK